MGVNQIINSSLNDIYRRALSGKAVFADNTVAPSQFLKYILSISVVGFCLLTHFQLYTLLFMSLCREDNCNLSFRLTHKRLRICAAECFQSSGSFH